MKNSGKTLAELREDYKAGRFNKADADPNPHHQFEKWFQEARDSEEPEANAMTLASIDATGRPSARIVLLKGFSEEGFIFYTNYNSRKAQALEANPQAALVFCWLSLQRQIRIEGTVTKVSEAVSTKYFQSRPRKSQLGAWASNQSEDIQNREELETAFQAIEKKYEKETLIPKPPHWGGYLIKADYIEFWQGRSSRLHDRIAYRLENETWNIQRIAP